MEAKTCSSCKKRTVNESGSTSFKCPQCEKFEITRCTNCRSNAIKYTCPSCEFVGPN